MRTIGVVTGSLAEARCLPEPAGQAACSGADAKRARDAAERLIADGARGLMSFGLAGALAPELRAGDLLLPQTVITLAGERLETDPAWRARLDELARSAALDVRAGPLLGSDVLIGSVAAKAEHHRRSGGLSVDMESHAVALAARAAGLPFVVIRAIADPADQALPEVVRTALDPDGRLQPKKIAMTLLRRPDEVLALCRLARVSRAGLGTLRRMALLAGPTLGLG